MKRLQVTDELIYRGKHPHIPQITVMTLSLQCFISQILSVSIVSNRIFSGDTLILLVCLTVSSFIPSTGLCVYIAW